MVRSARTAPAMEPHAPSRPETPPAASSWHSAQIPWSPASTASSPNPTHQSTPPSLYHNHCSRLLQRFPNAQQPPAALGDPMTAFVQPRHIKLGLAGSERNWSYAAYELDQLRATFADVSEIMPKYRDLSIPDMMN